jgi:hypothetical protein
VKEKRNLKKEARHLNGFGLVLCWPTQKVASPAKGIFSMLCFLSEFEKQHRFESECRNEVSATRIE